MDARQPESTTAQTTTDCQTEYQQRINRFSGEVERYSAASRRYVQYRTIAFLIGLLALGAAVMGWASWVFSGAAASLAAVVFVVLMQRHQAVRRLLRHAEELRVINQHSISRRLRKWSRFPCPPIEAPAEAGALAGDLDLFGKASVFQLLCQANTPLGLETLRNWLCHPVAPAEILRRQHAVQELAPRLEERQQLAVRGRLAAAGHADPKALLQWAKEEDWLSPRRSLIWLSRILPGIAIVLFFATQIGGLPLSAWLLALCVNLGFTFLFAGRIHAIFSRLSSQQGEIRHFVAMYEIAQQMARGAGALEKLSRTMEKDDGAAVRLNRLSFYADLSNLRYSPMFYFAIQVLTLWDFHVLLALEKWRRQCGKSVHDWFLALGEMESLCSLAALRFDNPHWAFPHVAPEVRPAGETSLVLDGSRLGHPLLPDSVRIANDVKVGPPGTVLLVTGSNMSGKSTLLRALGVNAVLAQAGGPVCAAGLRMPALMVATSMRIHDSLEDGVSFFMAELKRLKEIVDQARRVSEDSQAVLLYLLDEILQGTNSAERQVAVRSVIGHLIQQGAIGAVSTHDLHLADAAPLDRACVPVHFRETIQQQQEGAQMTFDYQLHPGVAQTTNALKLLAMVGLEAGC